MSTLSEESHLIFDLMPQAQEELTRFRYFLQLFQAFYHILQGLSTPSWQRQLTLDLINICYRFCLNQSLSFSST